MRFIFFPGEDFLGNLLSKGTVAVQEGEGSIEAKASYYCILRLLQQPPPCPT